VRERSLAEAGRTVEEEVVERFASLFRCVDRDAEVVLELLLADELIEATGPQADLDDLVVVLRLAGDNPLGCRWAPPFRMPVLLLVRIISVPPTAVYAGRRMSSQDAIQTCDAYLPRKNGIKILDLWY
jgi:hypothetical protein